MTQAAIALKPATLVPEARRMAFLPASFSPALMLIGERTVYQFMLKRGAYDYTGGAGISTSGAASPCSSARCRQEVPHLLPRPMAIWARFRRTGIIATLFTLSSLVPA